MAVDKSGLIKYLNSRGYDDISNSMDSYISSWKSWYQGKVDSFHSYTLLRGGHRITQTMASMQLAKFACEQWANFLFNEKCVILIDDGTESSPDEENEEEQQVGIMGRNRTAEYVRSVFDENDLYVKINEYQEKKCAYGTVAYIPYFDNGRIKLSYALADQMIPLSHSYGHITELCAYSSIVAGGEEYAFVQLFTLANTPLTEAVDGESSGSQYIIENILLKKPDRGGDYEEIDDISVIPGFEKVEAFVETGSTKIPFIVDKPNIVNNIDVDSPFGLAVFANSIDSMKMADTVFDSYTDEFILGRKRIIVSESMAEMISGRPVFDPSETVFMQIPLGTKDDNPLIQEIDMKIRADEHKQAIQSALDLFSYQNQFGENFFKFTDRGAVTATQVISENNGMFRAKKKHEIILESVLVDLIRLIIEVGIRNKMADGLNPGPTIKVKFDDSIIEDKEQEIRRRMSMVAGKLYDPVAYIAWYFNVSRDDAIKLMPPMSVSAAEEEGIR